MRMTLSLCAISHHQPFSDANSHTSTGAGLTAQPGVSVFTEESSTKGAAGLVLQTCGQPPRALSRAGFRIYVFPRAKKTRVSSVSTADGLV